MVDMGIVDAPAPNTIAKYIRYKRKPPSDKKVQSWKTFLRNHAKGTWSMDFAIVSTLKFRVLHVLFIISHDRRKIEHFAVTENPCAKWVTQQMRNCTPFGKQPLYLIHDNDPILTSMNFQGFLSSSNIKSKRIMPRCPWQNGICERLIGIVRRELLDHVIPLNERHLNCLLAEYVEYYNNVRTHQSISCQTPVKSIQSPKTKAKDTVLRAKPILGGLYHSYEKHSA
jgi:transposase InsO family protein